MLISEISGRVSVLLSPLFPEELAKDQRSQQSAENKQEEPDERQLPGLSISTYVCAV